MPPLKTDDAAPDLRTDRIAIRVTPAQKAVLTAAAQRSALDVSSWLRSLGMDRAAALGITEDSGARAAAPGEAPSPPDAGAAKAPGGRQRRG